MIFSGCVFSCDHGGYSLLPVLQQFCQKHGIRHEAYGACSEEDKKDYPICTEYILEAIEKGFMGVLLCGTGIGMSIAANRFPTVRGALCSDSVTAGLARSHNDANVLILGARLIGPLMALECIKTFWETPFAGGIYAQRLESIKGGHHRPTKTPPR